MYFAVKQKSRTQTPPGATDNQPVTSSQSTPKSVNWEGFIASIRMILGPTFLGERIEASRSISIDQKEDITGDGIPEALVNLGTGGAYTDYLTLMRVEGDKPVVAQFKQKDGKVSSLIFLVGASVANGANVVMLPDKSAVYAGHWSRTVSGQPFGSLSSCSVEVYQWDAQTKTFDFSLNLSNEMRPGFCQRVDSM